MWKFKKDVTLYIYLKSKLAIHWELTDGGAMRNAPHARQVMKGLEGLEANRPQSEDQREAITEEIMRFLWKKHREQNPEASFDDPHGTSFDSVDAWGLFFQDNESVELGIVGSGNIYYLAIIFFSFLHNFNSNKINLQ